VLRPGGRLGVLDRQAWDQVDLPLICRCLRSTRAA
jgi:hypothetical protein